MKAVFNILLIMSMSVIGATSTFAQKSVKAGAVTETVVINTTAQCDMCRMKIEGRLNEAKGVKSAILDIKTKKLTVKYNPEKTSPEDIKKMVSGLGYDADEVKANPETYKNLPDCCKKH